MKIATKKVLLGILAALCAVCIGAFVGFSLNSAKTAVADDPTVVNLTFNAVGINGHNDKSGVYGITRVTALRFTDDQDSSNTGVFSGNSDGVYNWDNLIANTTYTGSGAYIYAPANVTWSSGYKSSTFNFIYFCTVNQPSAGDTLKINAGAYFTMTGTQVYPSSGTCNDKYVLTGDVVMQYDGTAWVKCDSFTLNGAYSNDNTWNGCYGSLGTYLDDWGIEKTASSIGYWRPASGTIIMTGPSNNTLSATNDKTDNLVSSITGIKYNGTELKDISGAVVAIAFKNLVIYVPDATSGVVTIDKYTMVGTKYAATDYAYVLSAKDAPNSDVIEWSLAHKITFDSNGGTAVDPIYVASGSTGVAPTAPTKASVGGTEYTFAGWIDDEDNAYDFSAAVTSDITLTATWAELVVEEKTFGGFNASENNLKNGYGEYYATRLCFTTGVNSGGASGADFSDLIAKSTYSGSSNTFGYAQGCIIWPAGNKSDSVFNFIYLWTASAPQTNDTLTITAGAWFKTGGDGNNDKYVISDDISITFNGTAWQLATSFNVYDSINGSVAGTYYHLKDGDNFVYTMPTNLSYGGYKVFGFAITDNAVEYFYPAGGTHTSANDNLSVIAIIGTFDMVNGASVRITTAESSGIRWTANVDSASKGHVLYWGKDGTTYGTEISADGFSSNFDIKTNLWASDTTYNAVLTDINSDYYTTEFTAKAYVDIAYSDGTTTRIYAKDTGITRSIRTVAIAVLEDVDAEYTARQIEILTAIAG